MGATIISSVQSRFVIWPKFPQILLIPEQPRRHETHLPLQALSQLRRQSTLRFLSPSLIQHINTNRPITFFLLAWMTKKKATTTLEMEDAMQCRIFLQQHQLKLFVCTSCSFSINSNSRVKILGHPKWGMVVLTKCEENKNRCQFPNRW